MARHRARIRFDRPLRNVRCQLGRTSPLQASPLLTEPRSHASEPLSPGERPEIAALVAEAEQRGYQRALVEQGERVSAVLDALQADLAALKAQQDELAARVADSVEDIAFTIAERIVGQEIDRGHYDLPALVAECFAPLSPDQVHGEVMVYLSREDFTSLEELLSHPGLQKWRGKPLRLEIEPDLRPASCRIAAGPLVVSADPGGRIEMVRRGLNLRRESGHVPG